MCKWHLSFCSSGDRSVTYFGSCVVFTHLYYDGWGAVLQMDPNSIFGGFFRHSAVRWILRFASRDDVPLVSVNNPVHCMYDLKSQNIKSYLCLFPWSRLEAFWPPAWGLDCSSQDHHSACWHPCGDAIKSVLNTLRHVSKRITYFKSDLASVDRMKSQM